MHTDINAFLCCNCINTSYFILIFNGRFSTWTWVSQYQNVSIPDFIGDKNSEDGDLTMNLQIWK